MNSLNYLSRQFDVLASKRRSSPPPPTPSTSSPKLCSRRRSSHSSDQSTPSQSFSASFKRRSKHAPINANDQSSPKRSMSSPADLVPLSAPSTSPARSSAGSAVHAAARILCYVRRIFSLRIFVFCWDGLRKVWANFATFSWRRNGKLVLQVHTQKFDETETQSDPGDVSCFASSAAPPTCNRANPLIHSSCHESEKQQPFRPTTDEPPPPYSPTIEKDMATPRSPTISLTAQLSSSSSHTHSRTSRSPTPNLSIPRKPLFTSPKVLVLDLDETLIHSTSRPRPTSYRGSGLLGLSLTRDKGAGHAVQVILDGRSIVYHVYKRPFVDYFLRKVSGWYTVVIFTASLREYADPVIDWLDAGTGIVARRLFRDSCTKLPNGTYTKDLSLVDPDLSRVCLVDNSPISYRINEGNGIPIEGWTHDPSDEALLELLPILDSLRFTSDVRKTKGRLVASEGKLELSVRRAVHSCGVMVELSQT